MPNTNYRSKYFFTNISIFTPKRINVEESSPFFARRPMMDVIEKNLYCIIVGRKLPGRRAFLDEDF